MPGGKAMEGRMRIIGVTGGVGSGKSRVLDYLSGRCGAVIVRLDDLGREVMKKGAEAYDDVIAVFGPEVVGPDGEFDRAAIANLMLGDSDIKKRLEAAVFPSIRARVERLIRENGKEGTPLLVIESAILVESGYKAVCDEVWYIYADIDTRVARLRSSRGYNDYRIYNTMINQLTEGEFRENADYIIDNSGDFRATAEAADKRLAVLGLI